MRIEIKNTTQHIEIESLLSKVLFHIVQDDNLILHDIKCNTLHMIECIKTAIYFGNSDTFINDGSLQIILHKHYYVIIINQSGIVTRLQITEENLKELHKELIARTQTVLEYLAL